MEASFHARFLLVVCAAPPVERKGEKISGVRNAGKPCGGSPPERRKKTPLRLQVWSSGAEGVCAPPVERKGEKISGVRNAGKPRGGPPPERRKKMPLGLQAWSSGAGASAHLRSSGRVRKSPVSVTSENPAPDGAGFCVFCCLLRQSRQRRHSVASEMRP